MKNNIKTVREEMGLTQAQLAEKAGISRPFLCNVENGVASPTVEKASLIAVALKKTVDELFPRGK